MNISIFMTLVILSFTSNQVQATLISGALTEVHQNLVHCVTVISDRNFRLDGTLMISVNERTGLEGQKLGHFLMCQKNCYGMKNDVMKELNNVGRWSVTLRDPTGRVSDRTCITKHGIYIICVCFYSEDKISDIALPFINHLRYLRNASSWNTEARFLVTVLQGHPSCVTGVLVRSSLQELWSFKVVNVIISIQICDGDSHKLSQSSADLSSIKIIFLKDQKCKRQRNKDPSCLITDTDGAQCRT
jgi:hypothetical protein